MPTEADIYAMFSDQDEATAQEQAAALAAALRKRQTIADTGGALGNLALLSGDKVLGNFGQAALAGQKDELGRIGEERGMLAQAGKGRLEKALRAKELEAQRTWQTEQKELDRRMRAEELHARNLDRDAMFGAKREERQGAADEKQLKELSEDADKIGGAGFYQREAAAREIMEKNPHDLPGYGYVAGRLPDMLVGKEGVELRQAVGQMLSEYRKGQTGAGMSDTQAYAERQPWFKAAVERSQGGTGEPGAAPTSGLSPQQEARRQELRARVEARKRAATK